IEDRIRIEQDEGRLEFRGRLRIRIPRPRDQGGTRRCKARLQDLKARDRRCPKALHGGGWDSDGVPCCHIRERPRWRWCAGHPTTEGSRVGATIVEQLVGAAYLLVRTRQA